MSSEKFVLKRSSLTVAVVVGGGGSHTGLFAAVFVESYAGVCGSVGEGAVAVVAVEDGGRGVAGDVDIGPSVVVVVEGGDGEAVVAVGVFKAAGLADVFELSSAEVVVEDVRCAREATGAAHDGTPFQMQPEVWPGSRRVGEVEVYVVGDGEVEFAVAVVVDEGAARAPLFAGAGDAGPAPRPL